MFTPDYPCPLIPIIDERPFTEISQLLEVCVAVYQRPNYRSYMNDLEQYMGINVLKDLFDHDIPKENNIDSLYLPFPERWLNIIEQRSLFMRLGKYCPKLTTLFIKTHSTFILQTVRKEYIRILTPMDFNGILPDESMEGKMFI